MVDVTSSQSLKLISKPLLPIIFAKDEPPGPMIIRVPGTFRNWSAPL